MLPTSWPSFKQALIAAFKPAYSEYWARDQLNQLKQTGEIQSYINRFKDLSMAAVPPMAEAESLDKFTHGLKPEFFKQVRRASAKTLTEAQNAVLLHVDAEAITAQPSSIVSNNSFTAPDMMDLDLAELHAVQLRARKRTGFVCYNFGGYGHYVKDCPTPKFEEPEFPAAQNRRRFRGRARGARNGPKGKAGAVCKLRYWRRSLNRQVTVFEGLGIRGNNISDVLTTLWEDIDC